jgi:hypothetical protein
MEKQELKPFQFIEPGAIDQWTRVSQRIGLAGAILRDAAFGLTQLAESADDFFRGGFPIQAPYFPSESISLPWHAEYWSITDGRTFKPRPIAEEVTRIAAQLGEINPNTDSPALSAATYDPKNPEKSYMQGIAVETMLLVDGGLSHVLQAKLVEAIPWITAAHQRIIDCTCQAYRILNPSLADLLNFISDAKNDARFHGATPRVDSRDRT